MFNNKKMLFCFLILTSLSLKAELSTYSEAKLIARANIKDGFNLPPMTFLSNTSPVISNNGDVAFKLMAINGENTQAIWLKRSDELDGKIIYQAPDQRFLSEPSLSKNNILAFTQFDEGLTDGVFIFDIDKFTLQHFLKPENDVISYYTYPQLANNNQLFFRGTNQNNMRFFYHYDGLQDSIPKEIISEGKNEFGQKSAYLFKPSVNEFGSLAFKRRVGDLGEWDETKGDQIILLKKINDTYEAITVAEDKDLNQLSPYLGFSNNISLSNLYNVAFTAVLEDSKKAIVSFQDGLLATLAQEGENDISEIELFSPKINDLGTVVFRAKDSSGKRGIFITDRSGVKKIVVEGDTLLTDLGPAQILSNPNYPGFGGEVDFNNRGDIVFYCLIVGAKDKKEWGSAVYMISPKI